MAGNRKSEKDRVERKEKVRSAEQYRDMADEHMNTVKDTWKTFGKTGIFVLAALLAVLVLGIAWFVSNKDVQVEGMRIRSAGSDFELAAKGTEAGKWDSVVLYSFTTGDILESNSDSFMVTDNSRNSISWAVNESSNIENNTQKGIDPGSSVEVTCYVVSKKEVALTLDVNLAFSGMISGKQPVEQGSDEQQLLEGHLLLCAGYDDKNKTYKGWISRDVDPWEMTLNYGNANEGNNVSASLTREEDGTLTWTASQVKEDQLYPITIYWIWPEILGEYLFKDQTYLGNHPVLFPEDSTKTEGENTSPEVLPLHLFEKMRSIDATITSTSTSNRYFKWALDNDTEDVINTSKTEFSSLFPEGNPDSTFSAIRNGNVNKNIYGKLCSYYNMADQYLGENVFYTKVKLVAQ